MKNMSLMKKFFLSGGIVAIVIIVVFLLTLVGARRIETNGQVLSKHEIPVLDHAYQLKLAVVQVQQFFSDASATRGLNGLDDGLKLAAENADRFRRLIRELIVLDPGHAQKYRQMLASFEDYYAVGRQMAETYIAQGPSGGNKLMGNFDAVAAKLSKQVDPFLEESVHSSEALLAQQNQDMNGAKLAMLFAVVVVAVMMGIVGLIMYRAFRRLPLVALELDHVAHGDLTGEDLIHDSGDEVGQLSSSLNEMRRGLKNVIGEVTDSSSRLASVAGQLSGGLEQTESAVARQSSEVTQVATAMNEMSATAQEMARHSANVASAAQQADEEVAGGNQVVRDAVDSIRTVADEVEQAAEVIQKVDRDSDNIGTILDVIRGIADQTNLLALNAAIEAARAGEQGRGFAVVADEVRTLAQRSRESTQEIQEMIEGLQAGAKNAVRVMDAGRSGVERSVDLAGAAGERLEAIARAVTTISDMTAQIATAAEEQSSVAGEMNANINNINTATEQTADAAHQIAESGREMSQLADQLRQLVRHFKV